MSDQNNIHIEILQSIAYFIENKLKEVENPDADVEDILSSTIDIIYDHCQSQLKEHNMSDKKPLKPHDMRTKQAIEKLYGTTANRNVIHGMQNKQNKTAQDTKKEGETNG